MRELTGGVYFGEPKTITDLGNGQKRAIDTQVYDTYEIERVSRVAFELARARGNKLTPDELTDPPLYIAPLMVPAARTHMRCCGCNPGLLRFARMFTNALLPAGSLPDGAGSPLAGGADGRLWMTADGRFRGTIRTRGVKGSLVRRGIFTISGRAVDDRSARGVFRERLRLRDGSRCDSGRIRFTIPLISTNE